MTRRDRYALALVCSMTASVAADGSAWKKTLERTLETTTYTRSSVARLDGNRVTRAGTTFAIKKGQIEFYFPRGYLGSAAIDELRRRFADVLEEAPAAE